MHLKKKKKKDTKKMHTRRSYKDGSRGRRSLEPGANEHG